MVMFGPFRLPHVLTVGSETSRVEIEKAVPYRSIAYRRDQAAQGRTLRISGEIRESAIDEVYLRIDTIRRLNDGVTRTLDLEDGETEAFNAKLVDLGYELRAGDWCNMGRCYVPYTVNLLEVA